MRYDCNPCHSVYPRLNGPEFKVGDRVRVLWGAWKGKAGTIETFLPANGCYRVLGVEQLLPLAFAPKELERMKGIEAI